MSHQLPYILHLHSNLPMDSFLEMRRRGSAMSANNWIIRILTILFALCQFTPANTAANRSCIVDMGPYPNRYFPLIDSTTRGILFPTRNRSIIIHARESVRVGCPGKNNSILGQNVTLLRATCKESGHLELPNSNRFTMNCTRSIEETINETNTTCGSGSRSKIINIGWVLVNGVFNPQIGICFDYFNLTTEYTMHIIHGASVEFRDRDVSWQGRESFKKDTFFSYISPTITASYTKDQQRDTLTELLGSWERAGKYIGGWGQSSYLAKGHLSPDADFTFQSWQDATYHYINAVPQWQTFNNGNWKVLENAIRIQATRPSPRILIVYTGTYGVLNLPDINGNDVPIYLTRGDKPAVPVPKYMWKIVNDVHQNETVAFVLLNHPATTPPYSEPPVCTDVCSRIHWVTWKSRSDVKKGVIYCCSVSSLRAKFRNIPRSIPSGKLMES